MTRNLKSALASGIKTGNRALAKAHVSVVFTAANTPKCHKCTLCARRNTKK